MTFAEAPINIPIQCMQQNKQWPIGRKVIVGDNIAFQTDRTTWLYLPGSRVLLQVCPFRPENTMPADGFQIVQLTFYLPEGDH